MVALNWLLIVLVGALMVVDVGLRLQLRREHARYQNAHELMRCSLEKAVKDSDGLVEVCQQMIRLGKRSDSFYGTVPTRGMEVTHNLIIDEMIRVVRTDQLPIKVEHNETNSTHGEHQFRLIGGVTQTPDPSEPRDPAHTSQSRAAAMQHRADVVAGDDVVVDIEQARKPS